jgi:hypothetical protein
MVANMSYLMFELKVSEERKEEYRQLLQLHSLGVQKSAERVLRALQLMRPQDDLYQHGVVFTLARHVAEEVDAVSILVGQGCVEPCKGHLRSAFEADLGIQYVLKEDCERRAIAYNVNEARERLRTNERGDRRTAAGKQLYDAMKDDPMGRDVFASVQRYDFDAENDELRRMLASPPYNLINAEWEKNKRTRWHGLFGGPKSIRDLAYYLNKAIWYEFIYSDWSGHTHAGRTLKNVGVDTTDPTRKSHTIRPLRHPDGIQTAYNFSLGLTAEVVGLICRRYLSPIAREDLQTFDIKEIKPISERVKAVTIRAGWN